LDKNNDGKLNFLEIKKGLKRLEREIGKKLCKSARKFWRSGDLDGDKILDADEFYEALLKKTSGKSSKSVSAKKKGTGLSKNIVSI